MTEIQLLIVIVSYNTRALTLECLRSLFLETSTARFQVVVLDNASTDGSAEAIAEEFQGRVELIVSKENLGFAAGNNAAARCAESEFLLLLNPDTVVLNQAVDRLIEFARATPDAGIWGGRTLFADGSLNPASCWSRQTLWSLVCQASGLSSVFRRSTLFNPEGIGGWNREGARAVDIVSGCFFLIRREIWETLGGFRREFFMYGEEADLCLRARKLGLRPMVTSSATIVHYGGASERVRADKLVRLLRAKALLIHFHFSPASRQIGLFLLSLWPVTRFLAWKIATFVHGTPGAVDKCATWGEVVARKGEWGSPLTMAHDSGRSR